MSFFSKKSLTHSKSVNTPYIIFSVSLSHACPCFLTPIIHLILTMLCRSRKNVLHKVPVLPKTKISIKKHSHIRSSNLHSSASVFFCFIYNFFQQRLCNPSPAITVCGKHTGKQSYLAIWTAKIRRLLNKRHSTCPNNPVTI